jgi:GNAT superfamily N-acetyltransferase
MGTLQYSEFSLKSIRRIQPGETELYKQLRLTSLRDTPYAFSSTVESALGRSTESWHEQAESAAHGADRAIFIAFSDADPIGIAALYRVEAQPGATEMSQVWVAPEHRGTSTAVDLMNFLFTWARENNYRKITASVTAGNTRALQFYLRYGFSIINAPPLNGSECTPLVMEVMERETEEQPEA